jgi:ferredoxin, 2Fe-2S
MKPLLKMSSFTLIDRNGVVHTVQGIDGERLAQIIHHTVFPIENLCGGACACGLCHVFVEASDAPRLSPKSLEEEEFLDTLPLTRATSRLACQIFWSDALDGFTVTLAPEN